MIDGDMLTPQCGPRSVQYRQRGIVRGLVHPHKTGRSRNCKVVNGDVLFFYVITHSNDSLFLMWER